MRSEDAGMIYLRDYQPTPYAVETVHLTFKLAPTATQVISKLKLSPRAGIAAGAPLELDGDELEFVSAKLNGTPLAADAYEVSAERFCLLAPPADPFELEIETRLNPQDNTKLMGLYLSSGNYCTQCEAEGFRRITYYYDRPDVLAVYTTRIEADTAQKYLLGNGNPVAEGALEDGRHYAEWHDPHPKPAYLFALVAGDLEVVSKPFTTASGRDVALNIYVEKGNGSKADYAMDCLIRSMVWDEKVFGREYDLDVFNIVAVSDFNMGAMENKGLNIFNDKYVLADPSVATDADYAGIETVIAHEYFHNWTGNRITCRDWFQLCLKEGLTVYRDQEFSSDERSRGVKRIEDVRSLMARQFPEDGGPLAHPVRPEQYKEIDNFYTATVYQKGAELVGMIRTLLGLEGFRKGMDLYFDRHDGDAATIEDFIACFEEAGGVDLSQFALWYSQSGTPVVHSKRTQDGAAGTLTLHFEQELPATPGQSAKKPMLIPIRFGLIGASGAELVPSKVDGAKVDGDVIWLSETQQDVTFHGIEEEVVTSLLRGFSAPVILKSDLCEFEKLFLMQHDSDHFNRWQAAQEQGTDIVLALAAGEELEITEPFIKALGVVFADETLEEAFRALMLTLPSYGDLQRAKGTDVDPEAIYQARKALSSRIGAHLQEELRGYHQLPLAEAAFDASAAAAGKRALNNQALHYLAACEVGGGAALAKQQFDLARNMSDQIAALRALVHDDLPGAAEALASYRAQHKDTALAMDKWFVVQATAPEGNLLQVLDTLTKDEAFSWRNPNRVRAVVDAFASGNPRQFNAEDGSGYAYLAKVVLEVDGSNPQLAARLLNAFRSWKVLEADRREKAELALRSILDAKQATSINIRDIAERCLQ
ncbi:aminopeptidase N [Polycladidibacter hongkongensis]|uniref:aminopeptidase N n=1 Tax=Polycladidibacter hongkongensis TaxID=1647556 RepID=UPI000834A4F1|nr:aminopeptidase N [Pseudovibrio hongkongensis]